MTTTEALVLALRKYGTKEAHIRIITNAVKAGVIQAKFKEIDNYLKREVKQQ